MKKSYKKVQVLAKNAPTGSYAAGCPTGQRVGGSVKGPDGVVRSGSQGCASCEIAQ